MAQRVRSRVTTGLAVRHGAPSPARLGECSSASWSTAGANASTHCRECDRHTLWVRTACRGGLAAHHGGISSTSRHDHRRFTTGLAAHQGRCCSASWSTACVHGTSPRVRAIRTSGVHNPSRRSCSASRHDHRHVTTGLTARHGAPRVSTARRCRCGRHALWVSTACHGWVGSTSRGTVVANSSAPRVRATHLASAAARHNGVSRRLKGTTSTSRGRSNVSQQVSWDPSSSLHRPKWRLVTQDRVAAGCLAWGASWLPRYLARGAGWPLAAIPIVPSPATSLLAATSL